MNDYIINFWQLHSEEIMDLARNIGLTLFIMYLAFAVSRITRRGIEKISKRVSHLDKTLSYALGSMSTYFYYGLAAVVIMDIFGINTTSIIALIGAAGLAIGLALKDTLSNIAGGFVILILRPFKIGDFIECGSISGTIKKIDLFTTEIQTADGLFIFVPNKCLWGPPVKNFTRNGRRRMELVVSISYKDSIEKGIEVLQNLIDAQENILKDPAPQILVKKLNDSSIDLQIRAWARVADYWGIYHTLNRTVKGALEAEGLSIPFPQREVHLFNR